ncbi:MAG TPA: UpxY family transcription antiterminator [Bryobacteraceae bacterium]|nr:UpxY family transcription antiterminator [Bryobacteraceae bacterium]
MRTRSNRERVTGELLDAKGYETYAPVYRVKKRRSDRTVQVQLPLFPGYVFCKFDPQYRLPVLTTAGVVSIISSGRMPLPIPAAEISAIRTAIESDLSISPCDYLKVGQRVRVREGSLYGVEGILLRKKNDWRIVLSVDLLERSISVEIDQDSVEAV